MVAYEGAVAVSIPIKAACARLAGKPHRAGGGHHQRHQQFHLVGHADPG